ncbi:hypothetical protein IFM89_015619 [Coptis chinensis]|uniref:H(+)-exporting diphosphatase n=1 Tax=Coptis chinensis TaxID=261450 RepID=A0A835I2J4_9MAGN|nr:hypothetical protein IFM89_015619 [Coptis chinensis]
MESTISSLSYATDIFEINVVKEIEPALKKQFITSTVFSHYWYCNCYLACTAIILYNFRFWRAKSCEKLASLGIDFVTEYYTSNSYSPMLDVADSCRTGATTNVIFLLALGYKTVIIPIFAIADMANKSHLIRERIDTLDATGITTDMMLWFLWHSLVPFFVPTTSDNQCYAMIEPLFHQLSDATTNLEFCNYWLVNHLFKETLSKCWYIPIQGNPSYILSKKLKLLNASLKGWPRLSTTDIQKLVDIAKANLEDIQKQLHMKPLDIHLCNLERTKRLELCNLMLMEEYDLLQRTHTDWLSIGDKGNAFFHQSVKEKKTINNI